MLVLIHNPVPTIVLFIMISKKILCFQVFSTMSYYGVLILSEYCLCLVHTNGLFCIDNVVTVSGPSGAPVQWTAGHHCGGSSYGEHVAGTAVVGKTRLPQG